MRSHLQRLIHDFVAIWDAVNLAICCIHPHVVTFLQGMTSTWPGGGSQIWPIPSCREKTTTTRILVQVKQVFPKKIWSIGVTYKNYKKHQLDKSNQIKSVYYVWICLKIDSVPLNPMANHHYLISIYINGHLEDVYPRWFEITNLRPERYAGVSFPRPWKNLPSTRSQ